MPRLPSPEDLGLVAPRPSRGITEVSPVLGRPDLLTGKVMQDIGAAMEAEAAKFEDLVAEDALNKLREKRVEMTYGKTGFGNVRGSQIVERPVMQEFPDALNREIEGIAGGLNSSRAKLKFQQAASRELTGYKTDLMRHVAKETETYQINTDRATLVTHGQAANMAAMSGNVEAVAKEMAEGRKSVEATIARQGMLGPQADEYRQAALGALHSDVINGLLDGNQPSLAAAWLKTSRKEMTVEQANKFDSRVKSDEAWAQGDTFVREQFAAGKTTAEVEAALAEEAKKTGNKAFGDAGLHTLSTLGAVRAKTYAENADKAQDLINRGQPWNKIRSKWLDSMDPSVVAAFDQRAKALAGGSAVKTDFEAYYSLSKLTPEEFAKVDLRTYVDKLSDANLRSLADRQGKILNKDEKEIRDTVTLSQQLGIAHSQLGFAAKDRKQKGMFDEFVVNSIRAEEKAKGDKRLTDDERDVVIKRAMVSRNNTWNQFGTKLYYEVAGTPDAKDFVPEIPRADREAIIAVFVRKGKQPTEADIIQKYKAVNGIK